MVTSNVLSKRQELENKYKKSRNNLLLVVVFTMINIILLITKSNTYFLFSAYIPYALVDLGMLFCGMYPMEYYSEFLSGMTFLDTSAFAVFLTIALIIVALYLISWIFSKKIRAGWLVFALVIFAIDTAGMLVFMGLELSGIIDIVFHVWVIVSLILGINACTKLNKLPVDVVDIPENEVPEEIE